MATNFFPTVERNYKPGHQVYGYSPEELPFGILESGDLVNGMVNRLPRGQVPLGSGRDVLNARVRDDWTGRRPGTAIFGPTKPNSEPVLAIVTFVTENQDVIFCRVTPTSFHIMDAALGSWIPLTILNADGGAATFPGVRLGLSFARYFNYLYMADGVNPIWKIDFDALTIKQIKNAPIAKFIASWGNRIIAANIRSPVGGFRPASLAWSVNADPNDWTSYSSGTEDLGETDIGNEISGIFAHEDVLIVMRRKSIWHGTRQPFATNPFAWRRVIDGLGCDLPYATAVIPRGIIFADQQTKNVYVYSPGSTPQPVGGSVNRNLIQDITDVHFAVGSFDPYEKEYHLGLVYNNEAYVKKTWVNALEFEAWSYDDSPEISALGVISLPGPSVSIDSLVGDIDSQNPSPLGTIDNYGSSSGFRPTVLKGTPTGEVLKQSYEYDFDWNANQFIFRFASPNLGNAVRIVTMKDLALTTTALGTGVLTLEQSKDEITWTNSKPIGITSSPARQRIRLPARLLTGNDIYWRVSVVVPKFRIHNWWLSYAEKNFQRG